MDLSGETISLSQLYEQWQAGPGYQWGWGISLSLRGFAHPPAAASRGSRRTKKSDAV